MVPPRRRSRSRTIFIALALSTVAHVAVVPFLRMPATAEAPEPTPLTIGFIDEHRRPTPPPPTPTPAPRMPLPRPIVHHVSPRIALVLPRLHHVVAAKGNTRAAQGAGPTIGNVAGASHADANPASETIPSIVASAPAVQAATDAPPTPLSTPACASAPHDATVTNAVTPERPAIAQEEGAVGRTQVRVDLSPTGSVEGASVARSSGNAALDAAAVEAARRARYAPASDGCHAIGGSYLYTVDYTE